LVGSKIIATFGPGVAVDLHVEVLDAQGAVAFRRSGGAHVLDRHFTHVDRNGFVLAGACNRAGIVVDGAGEVDRAGAGLGRGQWRVGCQDIAGRSEIERGEKRSGQLFHVAFSIDGVKATQ
jgi:hypothetical protein